MNTKQREAFDTVIDGHNIFLTGPAGTGKTYTLQMIIEWARLNQKRIGITASTGLAAYLIKGRTVHSFLGIGLASKTARALAEYVLKKNKLVASRIKTLDILAIDEISMTDDLLIDKISEFLSIVRDDQAPFGGIQMIFSGDMCQLPPVKGKYCFQSAAWKEARVKTVILEQLVRQTNDIKFQEILQDLRWGLCTRDTLKLLKTLKDTNFANGVIPTKLYSVNVDVDRINTEEYAKLIETGVARMKYQTKYSPHPSSEAWASSLKIPEELELCAGAQVMVTWNLASFTDSTENAGSNPGDLVNGSRGVVIDVTENGPIIKLINGLEVMIEPIKISCEDNDKVFVNFIPLRLAYAITIHKSQGMTLDAVEIDLGSSIFEYGQAYTAISRARTLDSIRLTDVRAKSFKTHPLVKKFYGVRDII